MKKFFPLLISFLLLASGVSADSITLKSGTVVEGNIIEQTDKQVRIESDLGITLTYYQDEIDSIEKDGITTTTEQPPPQIQKKTPSADTAKSFTNDEEGEPTSEELYKLGWKELHFYQGDYRQLDEAAILFETIIETDPESPLGYIGMSYLHQQRAYQSSSNYDENYLRKYSLPLAEKALLLDPDHVDVHVRLGGLYIALKDYDKAEEFARKAHLIEKSGKTHILLGDLYYQKKNYEDAIDAFNRALTFELSDSRKTRVYKLLGSVHHYKLQEHEKGIEYYEKAVALHEDLPWTYNDIGNAYTQLKKYELAISNYSRALELMNFGMAMHNMLEAQGLLAQQENRIDDAIDYYEQAALYESLNSSWLENRIGYLYMKQRKYDDAIPHFKKSIQLDKDNASAYFNLSIIYGDYKADIDIAWEYAKKTIEVDPDYADGYHQAGRVLQMQKKMDDAIQHYAEYMIREPNTEKSAWLRKYYPPLKEY